MKNFIKIILSVSALALIWVSSAFWADVDRKNYQWVGELKWTTKIQDDNIIRNSNSGTPDEKGGATDENREKNEKLMGTPERASDALMNMAEPSKTNKWETSSFYGVWETWEAWLYNFLVTVAKDMKNIVFAIVGIYFLIMVFRLLFTSKTEEEFGNFKKWILWPSVWLVVMQSSYSVAVTMSQPKVNWSLWEDLLTNVLNPIIELMLFFTWFLFLAMMIYSAYRFITANGREEQITKWKNWVIYSVIWYIMVKISWTLVTSFYGNIKCKDWESCKWDLNLKAWSELIINVVEWMNTFILVLVTIIIIYAWGLMLTSGWNEEKMEKGKKWLFYALLWIFIVAASYTITIFFLSTWDGSPIKPTT
jgi:hypothetical protein